MDRCKVPLVVGVVVGVVVVGVLLLPLSNDASLPVSPRDMVRWSFLGSDEKAGAGCCGCCGCCGWGGGCEISLP